ncbi:MAG TPA: sn-glycerol-3-phosphate ABC transporter ATP-binding protein UgpC [Gemmatimonadaceae bacterium]|nr:sn-glycerol-3-phosphate ABC transporter ATP-binding protein UgpC [Gemmatimonadaceae bacterium]
MASVRLEGVRKIYATAGRTQVAVHGVDLEVADGELVVLVGPSGCGKSTTLRMIAGLESISGGRLLIGGRVVNDVPAKERDIAMVFQNYALYPHMTVYDNMAFALTLRKTPKAEIDARVREAAAILGIEPLLQRKPRQMSGGQRQRVAVGRALVRKPQVFLFDEPLSNLDAALRVQTRREIARLHRQLGATMIYVTHDQVEAMTLGDRIVVMHEGRVQQVDTPIALYERPANRFVAGFIGSPAMNFFPGELTRDGGGSARFRAAGGAFSIPMPDGAAPATGARPVLLGLRPESLRVVPVAGTDGDAIRARLDAAEPMGNETIVYARAGEHDITARVAPAALPAPGNDVIFDVARDAVHLFEPETGGRIG